MAKPMLQDTTATIPELMRYSVGIKNIMTTYAAHMSSYCCCQVCHFWSDFTMPATRVCQWKIDSEGYGINRRLKILTGKYSYVHNETHRATPTRQVHNSRDLGAHALLGLDQQKNDHLRSEYVFALLLPGVSFPVRFYNACHRSLSTEN